MNATFFQVVSEDYGYNWTNPVHTNIASPFFCPSPLLFYDEENQDLWVFAPDRRNFSSSVYPASESRLYIYRNKINEIIYNPQGYTLAYSYLRPIPNWYRFYGYPTSTRRASGDYLIVFTDCFRKPNNFEETNFFQFTFGYQTVTVPSASYTWNTGDTTQSILVGNAGNYFVQITDSLGGIKTDTMVIVIPDSLLTISGTIVTQPPCYGSEDGSISFNPQGGYPPYQILWSTGSDSSMITSLSSGYYMVTLTDTKDCVQYASWLIETPPPLIFTSSLNHPTFPGASNGMIQLNIIGGTPPYQVSWSDGTSAAILTNLSAGDYLVTISDAGNCFLNETFSLVQPYLANYQILQIPAGWSMISTYINPTDPTVEVVFSPVSNQLVILKNEYGEVYVPMFQLNQIGSLQTGKGYQIYTIGMTDLLISGTPIIPEITPLTIPSGWSLIAYLRQTSGPIATMLASVFASVEVVKSGSGLVWWPQYSVNQIGHMNPGEGYRIKLLNPETLIYPTNQLNASLKELYISEPVHFRSLPNSGGNMLVNIPADLFEGVVSPGDEIGIFNHEGIQAGSGVYIGETMVLPVWADNEFTDAVDGLVSGERILLKVWDHQTGAESLLIVTDWIRGDGTWTEDELAIPGGLRKIRNPLDDGSFRFSIFPNPATGSRVNIDFTLVFDSDIQLILYNQEGKLIRTFQVAGCSKGYNNIPFEVGDLSPGQYVLRVQGNGFVGSNALFILD
jgi:hypothetical protein